MTLNGEMALSLRYFLLNLVISGAYCVKVVDKAITMDNLRSADGPRDAHGKNS